MRYLLESSGAAQKSLRNRNLNYSRDSLPNHRNQFTKEQFKHFDWKYISIQNFIFLVRNFTCSAFFIATAVNFLQLFVTYSLNTCFNDSKIISKVNIPCITNDNLFQLIMIIMQGLFVPFTRVGSGDTVRVLRLFHNKYTGFNWSIYCWDYIQLVATDSNVLLLKSGDSETSNCWSDYSAV